MAMELIEIERLIRESFPDAEIKIEDLAGDGDHYAATIVSEAFRDKSRVAQHQLVYDALKGQMGGALHALALKTSAPTQPTESEEEKELHQMNEQEIQDWIRRQVANNDVVLFMKGTQQAPQCGFSAQTAYILNHLGVDFKDINVLEDMAVREGIKVFSNWPTIPQLYVKGEFVGGADIVREMFQAGELQELLSAKGIAHNNQTMPA